MKLNWTILPLAVCLSLHAVDFQAPVPPGGRPNPYNLDTQAFEASKRAGLRHALYYPPWEISIQAPYRPIKDKAEKAYTALGLFPYPDTEGAGPFFVPFPETGRPKV